MSNDLPPPPPSFDGDASIPRVAARPPASGASSDLPPSLPPPDRYAETSAVGIEILIPLKNPHALWAYYLGIFSLIPCLGIAMGIAAIVLGRTALKRYAANPLIRGRTHAWVGIIGGAFCIVVQIGIVVALVVMANSG